MKKLIKLSIYFVNLHNSFMIFFKNDYQFFKKILETPLYVGIQI